MRNIRVLDEIEAPHDLQCPTYYVAGKAHIALDALIHVFVTLVLGSAPCAAKLTFSTKTRS